MLHCQPGRDRAKSTSTFLHAQLSSPTRALIGRRPRELTPSLSYHLHNWHCFREMAFQGILLQRGRKERLAHQTAIWLLATATIFSCHHAEHRREYRRSGAAERSIDKLAAWGWYPIAKSPKTASAGPTGLKESVYATISETPASCRA
jgi:hypothetical protein